MTTKILEFVLSFLIKKLPGVLIDFLTGLQDKLKNKKREQAQKVAQENLDKVVADKKSTVEQRAEAYENLINTRE